jgi:integrase
MIDSPHKPDLRIIPSERQDWRAFMKKRTTRTMTAAELAAEIAAVKAETKSGREFATFARRFEEAFGEMPLAAITADVVRAWLHSLRAEGLSPNTIMKLGTLLSATFTYAVEQNAIEVNPVALLARGERPKRVRSNRGADEAIELDEVRRIVNGTELDLSHRVLWSLLLLTGARFGEAAGLNWEHWDRSTKPLGTLKIAQQWSTKHQRFQTTKTGVERDVPVHPWLAELLEEWRSEVARILCRKPEPADPMLPFPRARAVVGPLRWREQAAIKWWRRDLDLLRIEPPRRPWRLHATRHTFISRLLAAGAPPLTVKAITHAKGEQRDAFLEYAHVGFEAKCRAVMILEL